MSSSDLFFHSQLVPTEDMHSPPNQASTSQNTSLPFDARTMAGHKRKPSQGPENPIQVKKPRVPHASAVGLVSLVQKSQSNDTAFSNQALKLYDRLQSVIQNAKSCQRLLKYRGQPAQNLINAMQILMDYNISVQQQSKIDLMVALTALSKRSKLYPTRFMLGVCSTGKEIESNRLKANIPGKGVVHIKVLERRLEARELEYHMLWAQLSHQNVLPFYGICQLGPAHRSGVVTPLMENGNVVDFLKRNPDADRLPLVSDIAAGMSYIHDSGLIHGNIDCQQILITNTDPPRACLSKFSGATVRKHSLYDGALIHCCDTGFIDVLAFSMTAYEILTGHDAILARFAMSRPAVGLDDDMWRLLEDCWAQDPLMRPNARQIIARLETRKAEVECNMYTAEKRESVTTMLSTIFGSKDLYKKLLSCEADNAQQVLNAFQWLLDNNEFQNRGQLIAAMQRLSARTGLYPSRFSLHVPWPAATDEPVTSGGFADIYKVNLQGKQMCCKMIRMYEKSQIEHMAKVFAREAIVWAQLLHPNILPFCGLLKLQSRLSFVSFWAANGALGDYLARNPQANRLLLCSDTAAGVEYLHKNDIIHADLKGANVLIDSSGRASLGDFGLSNVMDPEIIKWTSLSTLASEGGSTRWHAPELLQSEDAFDDKVYATKASDVYAWAGICYEIFTGRLPFFEASETVFVMYMIMQGNIPTRPQDDDPAWLMHGLNDHIWKLMEDCWTSQHSERPSISEVIARLNSERPNDDRPPGDWGWNPFQRFCSSQSNPRMETLAYLQGLEKLLLRIMPEMT